MPIAEILALGSLPKKTDGILASDFTCHRATTMPQLEAILARAAGAIRGIARGAHFGVDSALIEALPKLEIVASFGVGYDGIDLRVAAERGVVVTNTPDVLTEEVADTALGLLLMTVRELSAAERHLRAGKWTTGNYPLTRATMRNRTVGIAGLGRIGLAIARRLDAMQVPVVYQQRTRRSDVAYKYYSDLTAMAEAVDTLILVLPGTAETRNLVGDRVLNALGPEGILINIGRGTVIDETALASAIRDRRILAAGLDVFANEPNVPADIMALENTVLLPHVGSASMFTRDAMGQLVVDNLKTFFAEGKPLTPVPETPWPPKKK